ncbi:hypothetical protein JCM5350_003548 [Sporobolomyces pararoseus]
MLSSLPPELLHQIIEFTVPHTFLTRTYNNRQHTLCSLSLVSKQFQAIAQPLLHEIVWIDSSRTWDRYKTKTGTTPGLYDRVTRKNWQPQTVLIGSEDWIRTKHLNAKAMSEGVLQLFSSVRSLTWVAESAELTVLPPLEEFSNLASLRLTNLPFAPFDIPSLSKLRSLTMYDVGSSLMIPLLDPAVVPSLKHFSLVDNFATSARQLKESRISDLLPQLETLNLGLAIWRDPELAFLHSAAERTLVDCKVDTFEFGTAKVVNLRLVDTFLEHSKSNQSWLNLIDRNLKSFISLIRFTPELSLDSLYLEPSLESTSSLPPALSQTKRKLVELCEERKIEVVYEIIPIDYYLDPWISEEFVRRRRALSRDRSPPKR